MTFKFLIQRASQPAASLIRIGRGTPASSWRLHQSGLSATCGKARALSWTGGDARRFGTTDPSGTNSRGASDGLGSSTSPSSGTAAHDGAGHAEDATVKQAYAEGLIYDKKGRYDFSAIGVFLLCAGAVGGGFYGLYRMVAHYVCPNETSTDQGPGNRKGEVSQIRSQ